MRLPIFKRINREQFPNDVDWIGTLLYPLNSFMDTVFTTLSKNLTFADNIQSFEKSLQFTTSAAYSVGTWDVISVAIPETFKSRVSGVIVLQFGPKDSTLTANISGLYLAWEENNRQVNINWIGGLADSTIYNIKVLVI